MDSLPPPAGKSKRDLVLVVVVFVVIVVVALAFLAFPLYGNTTLAFSLSQGCVPSPQGFSCDYSFSFSSTWNSHVSVNAFATPESTPGYATCTGPGSELYNDTAFGGTAGFSFVSSGGTTRCTFNPGPTPETVYVIVTTISPIL